MIKVSYAGYLQPSCKCSNVRLQLGDTFPTLLLSITFSLTRSMSCRSKTAATAYSHITFTLCFSIHHIRLFVFLYLAYQIYRAGTIACNLHSVNPVKADILYIHKSHSPLQCHLYVASNCLYVINFHLGLVMPLIRAL